MSDTAEMSLAMSDTAEMSLAMSDTAEMSLAMSDTAEIPCCFVCQGKQMSQKLTWRFRVFLHDMKRVFWRAKNY
jgi:hypothetical protein